MNTSIGSRLNAIPNSVVVNSWVTLLAGIVVLTLCNVNPPRGQNASTRLTGRIAPKRGATTKPNWLGRSTDGFSSLPRFCSSSPLCEKKPKLPPTVSPGPITPCSPT